MTDTDRRQLQRIVHRHKLLKELSSFCIRLQVDEHVRLMAMIHKPVIFDHDGKHYEVFPVIGGYGAFFRYSLVVRVGGRTGSFDDIKGLV